MSIHGACYDAGQSGECGPECDVYQNGECHIEEEIDDMVVHKYNKEKEQTVKPLKVRVRYGRTINIGNYESIRMDYEVEVELRAGDDVSEALDTTRDYLKDKMVADIKESKHK